MCILLFAVLVSVTGILSAAPVDSAGDPAFDGTPGQQTALSDTPVCGYVPSPVSFDDLDPSLSRQGVSVMETLPATFDLREEGRVTPVHNQGSAGVCWAFATYSSLESVLMSENEYDFSENNMKNLLSSGYPDGFDRGPNDGGDGVQSLAYLARWTGPVSEEGDPYSPTSLVSPTDLAAVAHVQDVLFLPKMTIAGAEAVVKQAVMEYGAAFTDMHWTNDGWNEANSTYYYAGPAESNHAVAIVGWNDSFSRHAFSQAPAGDGAWIIKNSWGADWGDAGYFYISYNDTRLGSMWQGVYTAEPADTYDGIYQYDPLGMCGKFGYSSATAWFANVFTATADEDLRAVSFYVPQYSSTYELFVYTAPDGGPENATGPVAVQNGTLDEPGYRTIPLLAAVPLQQGEGFSVVVKLTAPGLTTPVAVEYPIAGYSSKASANPGESYVSSNGETWLDLTTCTNLAEANVCLKAFTTLRVAPVANFTANVTAGTAPLAVRFTDLSTGSPTSWNWTFGDGAASTEQHPAHTYTVAGVYTVNLTVTNADGNDSMVKADFVTVSAAAPLVTAPAAMPSVIPTDTDGSAGTGETAVLSVAVSGAEIASVTVNLSSIGGSSVTPMADAGNGIWTVSTTGTVPSPFTGGTYLPVLLTVNATGADGLCNTSVAIPLTVVKNGDANQDCRVTLYDAVYTARHLLEIEGYPMTESVGMVSGGDDLSLVDAMYLAKHLLGLPGFEALH
ncbi:lectin like domain-containing protein [Methanoculleus taiwanensis]|uniref:lectin like domain-containing protein n=1 Tax=Methanoculleus taiwanensis TaxID=1550565 RepID=UPI0013E8DFDF|nr:lectin like domain-containing protein [Methanoculleus taiwanensis]